MVDYYRKIERSVTISADKRSTVDLQVDVWSADANITKFILKLDTADSTAIDLTDATVTTALVYDGVILQDNGQVEEVATQRISYVLNERLRGYEGIVNGGFYVTLKTGQKIDIQNVSFNMRKSLIDTDLEPAKENAYATFDTITNDVKDYANTQKSEMLAKTNEVKAYGDNQKTQIGQVLPNVQSKVSAINTELAKINENMPDLFVAYADDINGSGFSKTESSKLYKGYGIKNSTNPADYRWERNVDSLQVGGRNLARGTHGEYNAYEVTNVTMDYNYNDIFTKVYTDGLKIGDTVSYRCILRYTDIVVEDVKYQTNKGIVFLQGNGNATGWLSGAFAEGPISEKSVKISGSGEIELKGQFIVTEDMLKNQYWNVRNRIDYVRSGKIERKCFKVEKGNMYTDWSPAPEDSELQSNPINSILTTLSQEDPSTTLGGTWTQLGTESKFGSTIYYWKRTN